ncbi:MAG: hypothetical protein JXM69_15405 [Anaerolineae bacterium]|nr:hypothetical protein [Anaerolineae bacterium]
MYHLTTISPAVRRIHLPFSRDQLMLLMMAANLFFLGVDIYLAHSISGTIVPFEWIPIVFGPVGGGLLLLAGLIALKNRPRATVIATVTFMVSITVGLLGAYFHLVRGILPTAPLGERVSIDLLVWAPPILGPLMFSMVGLLGMSAVWIEDPPDSGKLILFGGYRLQLPYPKTQAYFYIVGMGTLATVISSVLDHARANFANPWLWAPTAIGIFGTVVAILLGAISKPTRIDLITYIIAMILLMLVGIIGFVLHVEINLTADGSFVLERFIRGAPFMAPLLFANIGMLGFIVLLDPAESQA